MRKLTDTDLSNIAGATVQGYHVEGVRVKLGEFTDSDNYGFILGKNPKDHYVTWQFHLDENEEPNVYRGHYFMENREAAIRDYDTRDLGIDKAAVWNKYLRYLRGWADNHSGSDFYGMSPVCFDDWYSNEYRESENDKRQEHGVRSYSVMITETLRLTVEIEAGGGDEAEQIASDNWRNSEYVLDADNFTGVEFEAKPKEGGGDA